jgi:hypothetical protein
VFSLISPSFLFLIYTRLISASTAAASNKKKKREWIEESEEKVKA